jgi:hypothetical protein
LTLPNQIMSGSVMNKPTRNELLAEYYLRASGVAAEWQPTAAPAPRENLQ